MGCGASSVTSYSPSASNERKTPYQVETLENREMDAKANLHLAGMRVTLINQLKQAIWKKQPLYCTFGTIARLPSVVAQTALCFANDMPQDVGLYYYLNSGLLNTLANEFGTDFAIRIDLCRYEATPKCYQTYVEVYVDAKEIDPAYERYQRRQRDRFPERRADTGVITLTSVTQRTNELVA
ncbi:Hypothetical protein POVN_LOCUS3 [uncultured virus]|nr:Hypothetical protein POVN_LOCUS3 [uncultured virus]